MKRGNIKSGSPGTLNAKQGCGCILAIILVPLLGLAVVFYIAISSERVWTEARPDDLSDAEWAHRRLLCDNASLGADECATTPRAKIEQISRAKTEERRRKLCSEDVSHMAQAEAERVVQSSLKSPSSADFVGASMRTVQQGCDWTVTGEVDAQNSFGALSRSSFRVELRRVSDDGWITTNLRIDD